MPDDLYAPPRGEWTPVSPKLTTGRRLTTGAVCLVLALIGIGLWVTAVASFDAPAAGAWIGAPIIVIAVVIFAWVWWWASRNRASWGYLEADEELHVRGGIMFRRVVVVPYGRMQFVDVQSGPVATRLGYASVTLHTAASSSAAEIPGVSTREAHRLRDRLTELGESHDAGV